MSKKIKARIKLSLESWVRGLIWDECSWGNKHVNIHLIEYMDKTNETIWSLEDKIKELTKELKDVKESTKVRPSRRAA